MNESHILAEYTKEYLIEKLIETKDKLAEKSLDCTSLEVINDVLRDEIKEREQAQIESNILCDRLNREIEELKELLEVPCETCGTRRF